MEYLRKADVVVMRKLHNKMTNALIDICARGEVIVEEGSRPECMFDALIRSYAGTERHLLVEVKTDSQPPFCRMAVGQLLDYRRLLAESAAIDPAVLLPEEPSTDALAFFGYVGVKVMWLNKDMTAIKGQVDLGKSRAMSASTPPATPDRPRDRGR